MLFLFYRNYYELLFRFKIARIKLSGPWSTKICRTLPLTDYVILSGVPPGTQQKPLSTSVETALVHPHYFKKRRRAKKQQVSQNVPVNNIKEDHHAVFNPSLVEVKDVNDKEISMLNEDCLLVEVNNVNDKEFSMLDEDHDSVIVQNLETTADDVNHSMGKDIDGNKHPDLTVHQPKVAKRTVEYNENTEAARKLSLLLTLCSYVEVCLMLNKFDHAHTTILYYLARGKRRLSAPKIDHISVFNCLLKYAARKGDLSYIKSTVKLLREENILLDWQSYLHWLEALGRKGFERYDIRKAELMEILQAMEKQKFLPEDIFLQTKAFEEKDVILKLFEETAPRIELKNFEHARGYTCRLLQDFNNNEKFAGFKETRANDNDLPSLKDLEQSLFVQLSQETDLIVNVEPVYKTTPTKRSEALRKSLKIHEAMWRKTVRDCFKSRLQLLEKTVQNQKSMSIYPYLNLLPVDSFVDLIMNEIRNLCQSSELFGLSLTTLCKLLGQKVKLQYLILVKQQNGHIDKMCSLYGDYLRYVDTKELCGNVNNREFWQDLLVSSGLENFQSSSNLFWPHQVLCDIGRFMYDIIIRDVTVVDTTNGNKIKRKSRIPAFYTMTHSVAPKLQEEIHPHRLVSRLYRESGLASVSFSVSSLPMLCPPVPWTNINAGGFLLLPTHFMRIPKQSTHMGVLKKTADQELYPIFDAVNNLSMCPWIINKPVLDLIIQVFSKGGQKELGIPFHPSELPNLPEYNMNQNPEEKKITFKERARISKLKKEAYSLWCDTLYKLSIANYIRDRVFWFPHNLDFRGRVYPTPPHFNHLGSDLVRAVLLFARGKPLGQYGLDWLKIHVINLTSLKKRESNEKRLQYANEILPDILDSAYYPLTGRGWWRQSEEPWQTLACCKEIAMALESGDPERYVSNYPVHQDGSCNGLQHYAALGRDCKGAEQVNLYPSAYPQDVYSAVAAQVEEERAKDAASGVLIAQMLEGYIKRKVIKQTVMTTVYGVTKYGARLQILKRLQETDFPPERIWQAANYLAQKTFFCIGESFSNTSVIQSWFTECASQICRVQKKPVQWITPLGLPVVQPYLKVTNSNAESRFSIGVPNTMKQKNAFPPNFIHSLDSTHMMLTSLYCERDGIDFVSVHDCYWTHPCTANVMSKICREQFVALHEQPILEDLSDYLYKSFHVPESEISDNGRKSERMKLLLNETLKRVPNKGDFELEDVLKSTYFFS